jgi:hypothetical protein
MTALGGGLADPADAPKAEETQPAHGRGKATPGASASADKTSADAHVSQSVIDTAADANAATHVPEEALLQSKVQTAAHVTALQ